MNRKFTAYWLFYALGLVFFLFSMNAEESTLLCVFYSIFVGTVWGLVPRVSGSEPLAWNHLLPPFLLVALMMFATRMKMMMYTEVLIITAMSLIHLRASILSFMRLTHFARSFSWIQLFSFVLGLAYLFQKNILPVHVSRNLFLAGIVGLSVLSIGILFIAKKRFA